MTHYALSVADGHFLSKGPYEHITRTEVQTLLGAIDDLNGRMLLHVLWTTGARISEVLALTPKDLVREYNPR